MNTESVNSEIAEKLDSIIAILQLAFRDRIEVARQEIFADPVSAKIIEISGSEWVDAGDLKNQVALASGQSVKTVERRIAALTTQRVLDRTGSGSRVRYRASGLI